MAIAGGGVPCAKIRLSKNGNVERLNFVTNKPSEFVETDVQRAAERLLAGEEFEMLCNGPQIIQIQKLLLRGHAAAPLTEATRPYYDEMESLRVEGWTSNLQARYRIAELTQLIWRETRNGRKK